jgi:hypothetical protein
MRSVKGALTNICGAWAELQCGPQEREDSDGVATVRATAGTCHFPKSGGGP